MIRPATDSDIPAIVALGALMHAEAPALRDVPYAPERVEALAKLCVPTGGCFVAEPHEPVERAPRTASLVGMAAGYAANDWWSERTLAGEFVVYATPQWRGKGVAVMLIGALEAWAREQGACEMTLGVSTGIHPERTARFYRRMGYEDCSVGLRKVLG